MKQARTLPLLLGLSLVALAETARAEPFVYLGRGGRVYAIEPSDAPSEASTPPPDPAAPPLSSWAVQSASNCDRLPYFSVVRDAANANAVPVELVYAVMRVESRCDPRAVSRGGALGLMQLMPATAASLHVTDAFDPRQSIQGGVQYLKTLLLDFEGNVTLAIAAYNAGPAAVRKAGGVPPFAETQQYVTAVQAQYRMLVVQGALRWANVPLPPVRRVASARR